MAKESRMTAMWARLRFSLLLILFFCPGMSRAEDNLSRGFADPPPSARTRAFWWWLNGNVTKAAITRDLEEMKAKGFGGVLLFDADGSNQDGNQQVPAGPVFLSPHGASCSGTRCARPGGSVWS
jgi:hypothetical protein